METKFNNIHYKTVIYKLNNDNGYYTKQPQLIQFNKLPNDLKVEETQKEFLKIQGANYVIRGRIKNGKYCFFTGLIPVGNTDKRFFGNDFEFKNGIKVFSLLVFVFSSDSNELTIYYFNNFYKDNRGERVEFVTEFINSLN